MHSKKSIGYGGFHVVRSLTYKLREKHTMKMGDIGTEFKYETDRIRVWDLVLESGISSDWHKHDNSYVFIVTRPGTLRSHYPDGTYSDNRLELGQAVPGQKDAIHKVTNIGDELYSNVIIELKE